MGAEGAAGSNVHQGQGPEAFPTRPPRETEDIPAQLRVRELAHALGYRFRLRRADLPGAPDLAFPRLRRAVFVRDCLLHGHPACPRALLLQEPARERRPSGGRDAPAADGWAALVVWACETGDEAALRARLAAFLGGD